MALQTATMRQGQPASQMGQSEDRRPDKRVSIKTRNALHEDVLISSRREQARVAVIVLLLAGASRRPGKIPHGKARGDVNRLEKHRRTAGHRETPKIGTAMLS